MKVFKWRESVGFYYYALLLIVILLIIIIITMSLIAGSNSEAMKVLVMLKSNCDFNNACVMKWWWLS